MIDVVIIIILIMLVGMVYCFSAIYDILKSIRKEMLDLRYSMVAEFEALHGITDDMKDIPIRDLRAWKELSGKVRKDDENEYI